MKKFILFAVVGSILTFFACQKDNTTATDPTTLTDTEFAFGVSDRGDSTFTLSPITFSALPLTVQTYLLANSDTSLIVKIIAVTDPNGVVRYVVGFEGHIRLAFDADGNLLTLPVGGHHGGGHHPHDTIPGGGHPPHDTLPGGDHPPHDTLVGGPHPPHDSIPGGGHPPHDSIPGGGHPGGGHPGGGNGGGHHGH